ncbi:hypothetical protein HYPSUDRAFT_35856, partial [Hypholoma sublateritium FD-334 SS-4]
LQASGVSLTDCAPNGRKEVADKMIIVDMLAYAMDHPAPRTLVLISGDRDYAYALAVLRLRRYHVVLVTLGNAHASLVAQASECLDWYTVVGQVGQPVLARSPERVVAEAEVKVVVTATKKAGAAKKGAAKKGAAKKGAAKKGAAKKGAAKKGAVKKGAAKKSAAKKGAAKKGAAKKAAVAAKAKAKVKAASKGKKTRAKANAGAAKPASKAPATVKKPMMGGG